MGRSLPCRYVSLLGSRRQAQCQSLMAVCLLYCLPLATYGQQGPIAHYPLDGNANDVSGNGLHGALEGGITFAPGQIGQGAFFNGVSARINLGNPPALRISFPLTIAAWFRRDSITSTDDILANGCGGHVTWFDNGRLSFGKQCGAGGQPVFAPGDFGGVFHHLVVTYNGSQAKIFVDGVEVGSETMTQTFSFGDPFWIGGDPDVGEFMHGMIDDLRIYGRVLALCEIRSLAQLPPGHEVTGSTCGDGIDNDCDKATDCADADCATDGVACPNGQIPAVSDWGMVVLGLLTLTAGTLVVMRRRLAA